MNDMAVALQRVKTIEQKIGLSRPQPGFAAQLSRAVSEVSTDTSSQISPPAFMTIGGWLGLANAAPATGLVTPLAGEWGSGFGMRVDPFTGQDRMHQGVDVSAPEGTPIRAAADGVVSFAGNQGGFGNLVIVDHPNGLQTYYAHQSVIGVSVGEQVTAGMEIGTVGSTGRSTGPHLHFEVRHNGEPVDPAPYLGGTH